MRFLVISYILCITIGISCSNQQAISRSQKETYPWSPQLLDKGSATKHCIGLQVLTAQLFTTSDPAICKLVADVKFSATTSSCSVFPHWPEAYYVRFENPQFYPEGLLYRGKMALRSPEYKEVSLRTNETFYANVTLGLQEIPKRNAPQTIRFFVRYRLAGVESNESQGVAVWASNKE
jgi:hypothetical protein